jgi:surface protein
MSQFNIGKMNLSGNNRRNNNPNIFNKDIIKPQDIYDKILRNELLENSEREILPLLRSAVKPKDKEELKIFVNNFSDFYPNMPLNWLDVSEITDMSFLFYKNEKFNGDISKWDVSNVTNMAGMFAGSKFNRDISGWNVSKVKSMAGMFAESPIKNISWDLSNVAIKDHMWG